MRNLLLATVLGAATLAAGSAAHADRRAYGTTYEAVTAPRGEIDVETWTTFAPQGELEGGPSSRGMREMIELEYGITDHWDAALYNMVDMITSGDTESGYAGFKLETRYRPSDRGEWPIDPVFYLEFQQLFRGDARQKYEAKLILAKDIGKLNIAANLALEEERTTEPAWNTEVEYAAGTSYALTPAWMIGAEVFGKAEKEAMEIENRTWLGPTVSWAGGGTGALRGVWVTLAGGAGLTEESDSYYARLIVGFQFH
jgi:opacity protein-like surface antigen